MHALIFSLLFSSETGSRIIQACKFVWRAQLQLPLIFIYGHWELSRPLAELQESLFLQLNIKINEIDADFMLYVLNSKRSRVPTRNKLNRFNDYQIQ